MSREGSYSVGFWGFFFHFFFFKYIFERGRVGEGQRARHTENLKQALR